MNAAANGNGTQMAPAMQERVEGLLTGEPLTTGYRPTLPLWALWSPDATMVPQFYLMRDIELMMIHPVVRNALTYYKAGLAGAEFEIRADDPAVGDFIDQQAKHFWEVGVPGIQNGYEYGWIGVENLYKHEFGRLRWDGLLHFSPRDCFLLTQNNVPVGVRVKNIYDESQRADHEIQKLADPDAAGTDDDEVRRLGAGHRPLTSPRGCADLWTATEDVPAKGLWYAHSPRYSQLYGQSQLLGAWRPWRRLAWKDGAETVVDGGFYRAAYSGPEVRYPEEDLQAGAGAPATTLDSQGRPRRYARDVARQIAELMKSGAAVGLPSTCYPQEQGGKPKWEVKWPENKFNGEPLLAYIDYLAKQIYLGIGVPPELLEAGDAGGYSGRQIPLEGFMLQQQRLADALLRLFVRQVLRPLVRWNFGAQARFEVKVKNLLETKLQQKMQQGGAPPQNRTDGRDVPAPPTPGNPGGADQSPFGNLGAQQGAFSLAATALERARQLADRILQRAA